MIVVACNLLRANPTFFSANEEAIRAIAKQSAEPQKTQATLDAAVRRVKFVAVENSENPTPNERYHLSQLNLEILSGVLFPDFLKRPQGALYADPRLTSKKLWRDVFKYDAAGKRTGWTR